MSSTSVRKSLKNKTCVINGYDLVTDETVNIDPDNTFESWQPPMTDGWEGKLLINRNGHPTLVDNIDFDDDNDSVNITSVSRDDLKHKGFDLTKITDGDMLELAQKWKMIIALNCFGIHLK